MSRHSEVLLVTTSKSILLVDIGSGAVEPIHRGRGLYYGIARSDAHHFVAARGRMVSSDAPREEENGAILVFDTAMRLQDEIKAPFPLRDMHEILWHDGRLWTTCSFDNMVAIFDPKSLSWERWHPLGAQEGETRDLNHFNSLAVHNDEMLVLAHNWGRSEILSFNMTTLLLQTRQTIGVQAHNIRRSERGGLLTCSSGEGAVIDSRGWTLQTGGFPRGIHIGGAARYVGISEVHERKDRDLADARIAIYDAAWGHVDTLVLRGEGLVLDLAPISPTLTGGQAGFSVGPRRQ